MFNQHLLRPALLTATLFFTCAPPLFANPFASIPQRRAEQFPTDNGYLLAPLPYSMPGIGEGYFLMGYFSNTFNSTADIFIVKVEGDAEGLVAQADEIPLYKKNLFLNVYDQRITRAAVNSYKARGMASGEDEFNIVEVNQADEQRLGLTLSLYNRRLEINSVQQSAKASVTALHDSDGQLITRLDPPYKMEDKSWLHGLRLDLTDDYLDPRRGLRYKLTYQDVPGETRNDPDYYRLDHSLSLFLPLSNDNTLALNYYQSDANVTRTGNTDPTAIREELNTGCAPTDTACLDAEQNLVDDFILQRTYGDATSLGGNDRLRGYPQGRFSGGHMAFIGAEYRWNFVRDAKPFNFFIWKDVTSALQLALFAEAGTVAEKSGALWDDYRTSYGIGGRLISASGSVYRADFATSDEGSELIVFFYYPWK
jgi:outer membrane protein assembly factor BamA